MNSIIISTKNLYRVVLLATLTVVSCSKPEHTSQEESAAEAETIRLTAEQVKTIGLQLGNVESRTIASPVRVNGMLEVPPQNMVTIAAPMGGFVKHTELLQGMRVKQGQVVVTLEHQDYIRLQQDYLESKTQLEFLEQEYKRQEELARENVNAAKVLQQALSNYNSAKAKEEGLRAQIKMIGLSAETIQKEGIKSIINITTPIAGYVTEVNVNRGKFVNSADVMFKIVDTDHLHAEAQVFEGDIMKLRTGQTMKLKLANETEERIATIYLIGKEISAERTVRVHGHLEKEDPLLIPGMYFAATIETGSSPVPALPEAAVVSYDGVSYIFIQKAANEFGWVEVKTGISESGFTHVILPDDFDRNAAVVTRGAYSLLSILKNAEGHDDH
ncbi:MAG: RND family efflux transporter, MFP subunit [Bacteroidetes bacterium OLB12]|nr:MAG: RND family efflux transporter, MFP subunit [Bacteroidetes bacterium OLB12]